MENLTVGYARASSYTQNLSVQVELLMSLGCRDENIFVDQSVPGTVRNRDGLNTAMNHCRPGDTLMVVRLDRLTRVTTHAIELLDELTKRRVTLSLGGTEVDPYDPNSVLMFTMLAAIAQHEHSLIHARTRAGIEAAKRRGAYKGRPRILDRAAEKEMVDVYKRGGLSQDQVAEMFEVSRMTVIRALRRAEVKSPKGPKLCPCGKPIKHKAAPPDSPDWACLVPQAQETDGAPTG